MLEINLLPQNLRKKKKKKSIAGGLNIPLEIVIGLGGGLIVLLIGVHLILLSTNLYKLSKHQGLKRQWDELLPKKNIIDKVVAELRQLQTKYNAIDEITGKNKILWAKKLNIISDSLPRGVWLKKVVFDGTTLYLDGSAISRENREMINVHSLIANLKENKDFLKNIKDLELSSIQSRKLKGIEVADFLLTTKVK